MPTTADTATAPQMSSAQEDELYWMTSLGSLSWNQVTGPALVRRGWATEKQITDEETGQVFTVYRVTAEGAMAYRAVVAARRLVRRAPRY